MKILIFAILLQSNVLAGDTAYSPSQGAEQVPYSQEYVQQTSRGIAHRIAVDIENGQLPRRIDEALNNLIKMASYHLADRGLEHLAMRYTFEYHERYLGVVEKTSKGHSIPDKYEPLSDWLRDFYNTLEFIFW